MACGTYMRERGGAGREGGRRGEREEGREGEREEGDLIMSDAHITRQPFHIREPWARGAVKHL